MMKMIHMRDCKINALDLDLLVVGRECHLYGEAFVVDCEKRDLMYVEKY